MAVSSVTTPSISPLQPSQPQQQNKNAPAITPSPSPTAPTIPGSQVRGSFLDIQI